MSSSAERATVLTQELIKAKAQVIAAISSNRVALLEKYLSGEEVAKMYKEILAATEND
ncbi:hypothetical protein [Paenibacillus sp. MZ03-122A]|uniref:hypothetical protein n=1 Tax=Paenibacillus sp. MZ03-122A TaxID=2962033 RepID=UPI0020B7FC69|nr:hypothetical protein [Paenibacillus sp. MZ03-122A]MCP3778795.1 hypothetical protein [Paenibacillus sp. MZ03-122A]